VRVLSLLSVNIQ